MFLYKLFLHVQRMYIMYICFLKYDTDIVNNRLTYVIAVAVYTITHYIRLS